MSEAPAWMVDAVFDALPLLLSPDEATTVAADIAQAVWDASPPAVRTIPDVPRCQTCGLPNGPDYGDPHECPPGFLVESGRVIPSRTSDPDTSHTAARNIVVKAGSQRAWLLRAFGRRHNTDPEYDGLTDEEAMQWAQPFVSPASEYAKRCSELRDAGLIEETGATRAGASGQQRIVSRITKSGLSWIRDNA